MAERIQLKREHGWRKPAGAVSVARPSRWGNPFRVERDGLDMWAVTYDGQTLARYAAKHDAAADAVDRLRLAIPGGGFYPPPQEIRAELAGKTLACWCPPGQPCHGDVLLELANTQPDVELAAADRTGGLTVVTRQQHAPRVVPERVWLAVTLGMFALAIPALAVHWVALAAPFGVGGLVLLGLYRWERSGANRQDEPAEPEPEGDHAGWEGHEKELASLHAPAEAADFPSWVDPATVCLRCRVRPAPRSSAECDICADQPWPDDTEPCEARIGVLLADLAALAHEAERGAA